MPRRSPINLTSPAAKAATHFARLRVEYWLVDRLKPYERNPRKNDRAIDQIRAGIREFGFTVPILAKSHGEIIDGHRRLKGAIAEKMREVPVGRSLEVLAVRLRAFLVSSGFCPSNAEGSSHRRHRHLHRRYHQLRQEAMPMVKVMVKVTAMAMGLEQVCRRQGNLVDRPGAARRGFPGPNGQC